jgi:hypothetical protein
MITQAFLLGSLFGLMTITAMAQQNWRVQVYGKTLDAETGKPVYCTVELYNADGERLAITETNGDGNYAMFVPADSALEIKVAENGYRGTSMALNPIPAGRKERYMDIALEPWH